MQATRILYLDDNISEHTFIRSVLSKIQQQVFELTSVYTYDDAVETLLSQSFDICLVDYYLNDVHERTGVDFVREMTKQQEVRCPFILLTVAHERESDEEGLRAGAVAYLEKPHLRPELLERTIRYTIEQHRVRRELEELYSQIRELEAFKASLVRLAGHNLRNHITNVKLSVRMLENLVEKSETASRNLNRIVQAVSSMEQLTGDILMLERLNLSDNDLDITVNLAEMATEICEGYRSYGLKPGQRLLYSTPEGDLNVRCEPTQLREAINNLINNASKYTPNEGTITVQVYEEGHNVGISVEDNGYGIPADRQNELFQPFARVLTKTTEHIHGTGLGLYLVKTLVEKYGGEIDFESTYGKGSRFWFTMPKVVGQAANTSLADETTKRLSQPIFTTDPNQIPTSDLDPNSLNDVLEEEPGETAELKPKEPPRTGPTPPKGTEI